MRIRSSPATRAGNCSVGSLAPAAELDLVAVKGQLARGPGDRLMLVANDGWYRRDRPKVPANVKFP